jgi:signal transduction histidine kinase
MPARVQPRIRVLVVEDDPDLVFTTARLVRKGGHDVLEATNGAEALTLAREQKPDLILLDVDMPGMDGIEVCSRIRQTAGLERTLVVMVTGVKTAPGDRVAALLDCADGYVTRPFGRDEFMAQLHAFARIIVTERDLDRSEAANRQSLEQAMRLEAVSLLALGVAHEFNNLLAVIHGNASFLLEDTADDAPHREDIREILRAATRARFLTQQLLAFSRRRELELEVVSPSAFAERASEVLRRLIPENIALESQVADGLPSVRLDPSLLLEVVAGMGLNAVEAMPHGGRLTLEVVVATPRELADAAIPHRAGRYVRLTLSDTGFGMEASTLARVFEPFFTTKDIGKGPGLGLAAAYGIVKHCGGEMIATSRPGEGSAFHIFLPGRGE